MIQWHPIFGDLLRRTLKDYYEVQTNVPVGDLPREADIILLQRSSTSKPPFRALSSHLRPWNVLEFKGRSESARVADIDLLAEVGLGIHRRLLEDESKERVSRGNVAFWYLANHLGKRFLRDVIEFIGIVEAISPGLWRGRILGRPLMLVSNQDLSRDRENIALHLVSEQSLKQTRELAQMLVSDEDLWQTFGPSFTGLYPQLATEIKSMAKKRKRTDLEFDIAAVVELYGGLKKYVHNSSPSELLENGVAQEVAQKVGVQGLMSVLTPEQLRELAEHYAARK